MNDKFDQLAKGLARSVTRRGALRKFGVGLAGITLATLGLAKNGQADKGGVKKCGGCIPPYFGCDPSDAACQYYCAHWCCKGPGPCGPQ